jgi:hypothetical protein
MTFPASYPPEASITEPNKGFTLKKLTTFLAPVVVIALGASVFTALHWAKPEPDKKEELPRPLSVFVEPV